jgi:hypothetical protein
MKNYNTKFYYIKNIKEDWEVLEWFFIKIFIIKNINFTRLLKFFKKYSNFTEKSAHVAGYWEKIITKKITNIIKILGIFLNFGKILGFW